jgi:adenosylcobinamide-GDP ribazoletransferase
MTTMLRAVAVAISFLTIIPVKTSDVSPETLARSAAFFPLAGWIIGIALAGLAGLLLAAGLPSLPAAVLLVAFAAWLTRGLHLDGVADLFDGLGGGHDPGKRLAIMKDSATGAFGVIGIGIVLLLKTAALSSVLTIAHMGPEQVSLAAFTSLAFVPAAARWAMTTLAWKSKYPRETGTGRLFVGKILGLDLFGGFLFLLPALWMATLSSDGIVRIAAVFYVTMVPSFWLRYRAHELLGGVTGDVLGASCEFGEVLGWLALTLFL